MTYLQEIYSIRRKEYYNCIDRIYLNSCSLRKVKNGKQYSEILELINKDEVLKIELSNKLEQLGEQLSFLDEKIPV